MRSAKVIFPVLLLLMLIGCGQKGSNLTFMHFWTSPEVKPVLDSLIAEYQLANPETTIELIDLNWSGGHDKITIAFATGTAADIIELGSDWVPEYGAKNLLRDLSADFQDLRDSLLGWEAATLNGRVLAVPWMLGTRVIFYNKDLMRRAGLDPAHPPANWDELLTYSEAIGKLGPPIYGFGANSYEKFRLYKKFLPFLWANGGEILDSLGQTCLLTSAQALQALDYYVRLSDLGFLESQRNLDDKFLAGELGFVISGDWMLRMMKASPPRFQVGACVIPGPNIPDSRPSSFLGGEFLAINASSRNQQKAAHFIRFLTSRAPNLRFNTAAGSVTPSNLEAAREILNDANPLTMVFLQQIKFARPSPVHPRWVEMQDIIEDAVQKAIYHKGELSAILDQACRQIEQITNAAQ